MSLSIMRMSPHPVRTAISALALLLFLNGPAYADYISEFVGVYKGGADVESADGTLIQRDMNVEISKTKPGFTVQWTSITYKTDGRVKEKSNSINFVPSERSGIYSAAMKRNVFGREVPLDPMKGEPFVWARIIDDTLTVFSLYVDAAGGYEMQQYDRTLADGGLMLDFSFQRNGQQLRSVSTFLKRQ